MSTPLRCGGVFINPEDVFAFCRTDYAKRDMIDLLAYGSTREAGRGNCSVDLYTRLRESGRSEPLVHFSLCGRDAIEVWEAASRLAGGGGEFARCGRWVLRPRRVRLLRYTETGGQCSTGEASYTVYLGMTDDTAGGWVSKVQLDLESGRALEGLLGREDLKAGGA